MGQCTDRACRAAKGCVALPLAWHVRALFAAGIACLPGAVAACEGPKWLHAVQRPAVFQLSCEAGVMHSNGVQSRTTLSKLALHRCVPCMHCPSELAAGACSHSSPLQDYSMLADSGVALNFSEAPKRAG